MPKIKSSYLEVEPFGITERGFHKEKNQVSESLFSLGNEYSGVRSSFDESSSLPSLRGTYYNGIIEYAREDVPTAYKGIVKRSHFTINSCDYFLVEIRVDGEKLDLGKCEAEDFVRHLDFRTGLLTRTFTWVLKNGNRVGLSFKRILGMVSPHEAVQEIRMTSAKDADLELSFILDGTILHWGDHCYWNRGEVYQKGQDEFGVFEKTPTTRQSLLTAMRLNVPLPYARVETEAKKLKAVVQGKLKADREYVFTRYVVALADKKSDKIDGKKELASKELDVLSAKKLEGLLSENTAFFKEAGENSDITIEGDEEDQQGIRFCLFNLQQAYTGLSEDDNIGAKGLTGEAYSGHAFWDSETYCLPYYLFTSRKEAKNLLLFRYHTLEQAKKRAKDLDCTGACYPIATRNGEEGCTLWQHASTQLQPTTGVAYAIMHYMNLYDDHEFMRDYGAEMLAEIAQFLMSRGQWNGAHTHFGYYGVMGPDEFEVMVNHNTYTNYMGKRTLEYAYKILNDPEYGTDELKKKTGVTPGLLEEMKLDAEKMLILYDDKTKLFEQHMGYYDLPHIDVGKIPVTDFPLYEHWSYDRIYRNDMIKQPDVLMFLFLFDQSFSKEVKKANFDFYEPRCIHESSLSPSVHSILAEEIGYEQKALDFFGFATRLDLDDYNRNTKDGLHMTSIAAAWMNIVYGFLGLRSEEGPLSVSPHLPKKWTGYSVRLSYRGSRLVFKVTKDSVEIENKGKEVELKVYGEMRKLKEGVTRIARV